MILTALSSDVWSRGLQANPCYPLWFKREKSDVILSLINTNIKLEEKWILYPREICLLDETLETVKSNSENHTEINGARISVYKFRSFPSWKRTSEDGLSPTGCDIFLQCMWKKGSWHVDYNYVDILILYTKISIFPAEPFPFTPRFSRYVTES